jgi:hypothetical protein
MLRVRNVFDSVFFKDFIHFANVIFSSSSHKRVQMVWHENISAEPSSMCRTVVSELDQRFMNGCMCEEFSTFLRACSYEINRLVDKNYVKPTQPLLSGEFGGQTAATMRAAAQVAFHGCCRNRRC